ncbi:MAG: hypothetical protein A3I31_01885 [Candidatus Colwellbacteria bacterium RIFCSPLOWO2_02_FULL_44_20b]|uniref:Uncharacterized protein n=1 Tax=Candidatus Colwellbacteria bacterium RIFCSPLOWO2_02_FULL_44_20b TaxID=1797691 RepID=A0A1G1Z4A9_9BACT|nr:MAG: hypothetical protein A3I31_01885 [Candidatus Colwellbacteria bacterium RIFCSPLOWO2_02_FULL_44_20b]
MLRLFNKTIFTFFEDRFTTRPMVYLNKKIKKSKKENANAYRFVKLTNFTLPKIRLGDFLSIHMDPQSGTAK